MDCWDKNFYFDNDVVITSTTDESGIQKSASLDGYDLRSFGLIIFNACSKGTPLIEINFKLREKRTDDYIDPLFAIVFGDIDGVYSSKLYYCHDIGRDYVEITTYDSFYLEDYRACYDGLCQYRDGAECTEDTMKTLKSVLNKAVLFMQDKLSYLAKSQ